MEADYYKKAFSSAIAGKGPLIHQLAILTEQYIETVGIPLRPVYDENPQVGEDGYLMPVDIVSAGTPEEIEQDDILRNFRGHIVILDAIANDKADFDEIFDTWGRIPTGTTRLEILTVHNPMPSMNQICMASVRMSDSPHDYGDIIRMPDAIRNIPGAKTLIEQLNKVGRERNSMDLY